MWTRCEEHDGAGCDIMGCGGSGGGLLCPLRVSGDTSAAPADAGLGSGGTLPPDTPDMPENSDSAPPHVPRETWEPPDMLFGGME